MLRELRMDRAIYVVDDEHQKYRFLKRNPEWELLDHEENERNKREIDRYTRVFRDGRTKTYQHQSDER